ncbi:hypothetical protein AURDEDRAFT_171211 [Auricularia subglabra TFB-10046 SS5]|uniref:Uncharacterized protein n=1 Tax=Auricularia subglabra (strain TFB-10046 / SS5) TaxID=717982 RepID=J0WXQ4_AURST|nr:hypothetical protein AURDEDRAFT_171211 [Auricularia subglabra TFB-10046 SS5]
MDQNHEQRFLRFYRRVRILHHQQFCNEMDCKNRIFLSRTILDDFNRETEHMNLDERRRCYRALEAIASKSLWSIYIIHWELVHPQRPDEPRAEWIRDRANKFREAAEDMTMDVVDEYKTRLANDVLSILLGW